MYKCPYCSAVTNNRGVEFISWFYVGKHARVCSKNTHDYVFDSIAGPIHYSVFTENYSADYIRYLYPNLSRRLNSYRDFFKKHNKINIDNQNETSWKKEELIKVIKDFYLDNDRIPTNREFNESKIYPSVHPFIRVFGSWNGAITAAGFISNKNLYGTTVIGKDGNLYKSLLEKKVADLLFENKLSYTYESRYPYPFNELKYDFKIASKVIEVAGGTSDSYKKQLNKKIEINKSLLIDLYVYYPNTKESDLLLWLGLK